MVATLPNILVTGTPGTGKTTLSQMLEEALAPVGAFKNVNVGDVVKAEKAHTGWDEDWQAFDVDEDKVRVSRLPSRALPCLDVPRETADLPREGLVKD